MGEEPPPGKRTAAEEADKVTPLRTHHSNTLGTAAAAVVAAEHVAGTASQRPAGAGSLLKSCTIGDWPVHVGWLESSGETCG